MPSERSPKRQKTSPGIEVVTNATQPSQLPLPPDTPKVDITDLAVTSSQQLERSSFFSSWSKRAPPITQLAQDGIKTASSVASEVASSIKDVQLKPRSIRSPSLAMTLGKGRPSRASIVDATTTMVYAEGNSTARKSSKPVQKGYDEAAVIKSASKKEAVDKNQEQVAPKPNEQLVTNDQTTMSDQNSAIHQRSGWLGWIGRGDTGNIDVSPHPLENESQTSPDVSAKSSEETVAPSKPAIDAKSTKKSTADEPVLEVATSPALQQEAEHEAQALRRSWLPLWGASTLITPENTKPKSSPPMNKEAQPGIKKVEDKKEEQLAAVSTKLSDQPQAQSESTGPPTLPHDGTRASAWAFWSRDRNVNSSSSSIVQPRDGEIAISDTSTQDKPKKASLSIPNNKVARQPEPAKSDSKQKETVSRKSVDKPVTAEAEPPKALDTTLKNAQKKQNPITDESMQAETSHTTATAVELAENKKHVLTKSSQTSHNLLLPTLHSTLKLPESPSLLSRLAGLLYTILEPEARHLSLVKDTTKIKNALAIGVHGYFPAPLLRSVLGQPTGTSIKFADMAAKSIKRWTLAHGYECQVKTAALEGEGKIAERLELLWRLLLNWIEEIRKADFVMIACHSQGVPVAIMLVAKLIQFGCVNSTRVSICAMAGVNMGPFPEYKSRWIGGSAGELFEFSDPSSRVSADYLSALETVLKFGVRLTFIGSIDDQLVSLESSVYSPLSHPHIFRAVSIDSRVHAPNFLSHLVGFAFKLRNLGVQDHGLIRELSSPLAGSLYTGEGHSRIYEDNAVYDLAVSFALETTSLPGVHISQRNIVSGGNNPYILPFAMRGILEEEFVKNELRDEADELLKEFDDWKPTSKTLKDVKFRLEGIRSKL